jgi:hypothetical protein
MQYRRKLAKPEESIDTLRFMREAILSSGLRVALLAEWTDLATRLFNGYTFDGVGLRCYEHKDEHEARCLLIETPRSHSLSVVL